MKPTDSRRWQINWASLTVGVQYVLVSVDKDVEDGLAGGVERQMSFDVRSTAVWWMLNVAADPRNNCVNVQFHHPDTQLHIKYTHTHTHTHTHTRLTALCPGLLG